jgi:hypothetical protein
MSAFKNVSSLFIWGIGLLLLGGFIRIFNEVVNPVRSFFTTVNPAISLALFLYDIIPYGIMIMGIICMAISGFRHGSEVGG